MSTESSAVIEEPSVQLSQDEADELAGFEAAMTGEKLPEETEKVNTPPEEKSETVKDESPPQSVETPAPPAGISKEQLDALYASANTVEELKQGLAKLRDDAFGRLGGLERSLKQTGEAGFEWDIATEDLKDIEEQVPFLAPALQKTLANLAKKAKVKVPIAQPIDVDAVKRELKGDFDRQLQEQGVNTFKATQSAILDYAHPGWIQTVQRPEFHAWLDKHEAESPGVKNMFLKSNLATEIGGVLMKFQKAEEAAAKAKAEAAERDKQRVNKKPAPPSRTQRLMEAIPPKASSSNPPPPKGELTEEEAFEAVMRKK